MNNTSEHTYDIRPRRRQLDRKRKWKIASQTPDKSSDSSCSGSSSAPTKAKKCLKYEVEPDENKELCSLLALPNELLDYIIIHLTPQAIGRLATACGRLYHIVNENQVWRELCRRHQPLIFSNHASSFCGWKRQFIINHTKKLHYQMLGHGNSKKCIQTSLDDVSSAYGLKKICSSRDHLFIIDHACNLHVFRSRWERHPVVKDFCFKRVNWHSDFAQHVIDITTDPRYDNTYRRYVYVLTQSEGMRNRRRQHNTRSMSSTNNSKGWDKDGQPIAGDKIDVFDERSCRRVFNMTFDPEMRFVSMKLTSVAANQKTLYILTDLGKVYSLHLFESSLLNLGSEGMQVTLKSVSKNMGEKVAKVESSTGITCFITETGKMFISSIRKSDYSEIFGRKTEFNPGVPQVLPHVAKIVSCSVAEKHLGFIDEYNRLFMIGNNRYGQLGTGDRMDRDSPVQILCQNKIRTLKCGLNHTLVVVENDGVCELYGCGSGNTGRLPGCSKGTVQMTKLTVKVPWSILQVDSHKECLFLLSCYDPDKQVKYKEHASSASNKYIERLSIKSQQELLMDLRKSVSLVEKLRILETMVGHVIKSSKVNTGGVLSEKFQRFLGSLPAAGEADHADQKKNFVQQDLEHLKSAVEQVRLDVERVELDQMISSQESVS